MADSDNILQDDYVGDLDIDADEEDALLEKGFENRHSIFLDKDGEKVHRYNFDDEEEEDILDIGVTEDLSLIESEQFADYTATLDNSLKRIVEKKDGKITFPKQNNQSMSSSGLISEGSVPENVPSSTSGVEEVTEETEKDDSSRFKGAKKIVISNSNPKGSLVKPNFQIFTKELRNRREQSTNIKKRLGGQMRQGNMRMRHPHQRFMNSNQGGGRMMSPPQFRPPGPYFRAGGPPFRHTGPPPPHLLGPPQSQQRSPGPWPRKILINPHFNQNNQNKNQQWGGQNQSPQRFHQPQPQEWHPPPQNRPQFHPHQPQQQPRFRHAVPSMEYDQRKEQFDQYPTQDPILQPSPIITPEPQPPAPYYQQQQNYRPEYGTYHEPPSQNLPPPTHPHAPPQAPSFQQGYYQQYPDMRPPPQQVVRMEPGPPSYDMQPQPYASPFEASRHLQQPPVMGHPDVEIINEPYMEPPILHQNYPPQAQYDVEAPNQYGPSSYEDPNQINNPRPPPDQFHQPSQNPVYRSDFNRGQVPPRPVSNQNQYAPDPNHDYTYEQPLRNEPYVGRPVNQFSGQSTSEYTPEPRQPHSPVNQYSHPGNQGFAQVEMMQVLPVNTRGNIKSRLGARVPIAQENSGKRLMHQSPEQGRNAPSASQKNVKRNLNTILSVTSPSVAAKQPRYDQTSAKKVLSRNLQEVHTISNLPDTTTFGEKEVVIEDENEDEEMKEYRKRIEAQKSFREKIFQIKEARRKQAVLQQSRPTTKGTTNPVIPVSKVPEIGRSIQPIATIVSVGAGKRNSPGTLRKPTPASANSNALAKRALRFGSHDQGNPTARSSYDIVDQSKPEGSQECVILPDTTHGQPSSQTATLEPLKSVVSQPRTLDERFSNLKSGVLVQPQEERFTTSSNRTVLPASQSLPKDPNVSNIVIIDNLSASTKAQQLVDIASQCGKLAELNLKQSQKQAILKFKTSAGAAEFFKKYQRKMIDLSMISLTMGPPAKSS